MFSTALSRRESGSAAVAATAIERQHRDGTSVDKGSNVRLLESHQCFCAARRGHELDLEAIRHEDLHDGPQVALSESVLGQIPSEHNGVENLEPHGLLAGNAVTNLGRVLPLITTQTVAT